MKSKKPGTDTLSVPEENSPHQQNGRRQWLKLWKKLDLGLVRGVSLPTLKQPYRLSFCACGNNVMCDGIAWIRKLVQHYFMVMLIAKFSCMCDLLIVGHKAMLACLKFYLYNTPITVEAASADHDFYNSMCDRPNKTLERGSKENSVLLVSVLMSTPYFCDGLAISIHY